MNNEIVFLLLGLMFSALTSATILPGTSDASFVWFAINYPDWASLAWLIVGISNSLGSMISYYMGRMLPEKKQQLNINALQYLRKCGAAVLLFSWVPVVGDALPIAAGWLRLSVFHCILWITLGKFLRYSVLWYVAA